VRLLVAEDDAALRSVLERGLRQQGYVVDVAADGTEALRFLATYEYEVVVLDWRMPGQSGVDVLRTIRRRQLATPVLMLTARDTTADRVEGLDAGADDYLVKPFAFEELAARLRALQRRAPNVQGAPLAIGDLVLDPATREVTVAGRPVSLTATELAILEVLVRRTPSVVSRAAIALHAWDREEDALGSNTIEVHMARLRAKLGDAQVRIHTVRGAGYRLTDR
jgi:DNA-binding response OmpR family regulator